MFVGMRDFDESTTKWDKGWRYAVSMGGSVVGIGIGVMLMVAILWIAAFYIWHGTAAIIGPIDAYPTTTTTTTGPR